MEKNGYKIEDFNYIVKGKYYDIYAQKDVQPFTQELQLDLNKKLLEYLNFFNKDELKEFDKFYVMLFSNNTDYRIFSGDFNENKIKKIPEYSRGCFDYRKINLVINEDSMKNTYGKKSTVHELFHHMYLKCVLKGDFSKRIVWYDEGMAQLMSGQYEEHQDNKVLENFYKRIRANTIVKPRMNDINHVYGNFKVSGEYDGYALSYLCVKYLNEKLKEDEFKNLKGNFSKIKQYGDNILDLAFNYYDKILFNNQNFDEHEER